MYLLLNYGHEPEKSAEEKELLDSNDDVFRISLICTFVGIS